MSTAAWLLLLLLVAICAFLGGVVANARNTVGVIRNLERTGDLQVISSKLRARVGQPTP